MAGYTDIQVKIDASIGGFDAKMKSAAASADVFARELGKAALAEREIGAAAKEAEKVAAAQRKIAAAESSAYRENQSRMAQAQAAQRQMASVEATAYRESATRDTARSRAQERAVSDAAKAEAAQRRMAAVESAAYREDAARSAAKVQGQGKIASEAAKAEAAQRRMASVEAAAYREDQARDAGKVQAQAKVASEAAKVEAAQRRIAQVEAAAYRESAARDAAKVQAQSRIVSEAAKVEAAQRKIAQVEAAGYREAAARDATRAAAQGKLANGMLVFGAASVAAAGYAVSKFASFDKSMSRAGAATMASASDMKLLRAEAISTGAATQYTAGEAADAITAMGKAGVGTQDILSGGLTGALSLAASGELDVGQSAEIAAVAMTQFGLTGKDLPHVADLLAAGAGKAQGSVQDLAGALKYVGPVAHMAGVSIEQTTGFLAELAAQGIVGEQAGTSFRGILLRLESPSKKAAAAMKDYGISVYDANGKMLPFGNIAGQLHDKLGKLSEAQRNAALRTIFGNEQFTAATVLYQGGAKALDEWTKKVNDSGFATRQAGMLMNNLSGDVERLKGSLDTALIQSGSGANAGLRDLTQGAEAAVNAFGSLPSGVQESTVMIGGLVGGVALLAGGLLKGVLAVRSMRTGIAELGITADGARGKLVGAAKGAAMFAAFEGAAAGLGALEGDLQDTTVRAGATELALKQIGSGLPTAQLGTFGKSFGDLGSQLRELSAPSVARRWQDIDSAVSGVVTFGQFGNTQGSSGRRQFLADMDQLDASLAGLVKGGNADQAKALFEQLNTEAIKGGAGVNQLANHLPAYRDALAGVASAAGTAGTSASDMGTAVGGAASKTGDLAAKAEAAKKAVSDLGDALKAIFNQEFGVEAAQDAAAKDLIAIQEAAKGKTTGGTKGGKITAADRDRAKIAGDRAKEAALARGESSTQATAAAKTARDSALAASRSKATAGTKTGVSALEARELMRGYVQDQMAIITAMAEAGSTPAELTARAKTLAENADKAAAALGLTGAAATHYGDVLRTGIPEAVTTSFSTPGLDPALAKVIDLQSRIALINGKQVKFTVGVDISPDAANIREGRFGVAPQTPAARAAAPLTPAAKTAAKATAAKAAKARVASGAHHFSAGGLLEPTRSYASGEAHTAQIATGARMWAEPETGGEAYIPLAVGKRARSSAILAEVAHRFGMTVARPATQVHVVRVPVQESHSTTYPVTNHIGQVVTQDQASFTDWSRQQGQFNAAGVR